MTPETWPLAGREAEELALESEVLLAIWRDGDHAAGGRLFALLDRHVQRVFLEARQTQGGGEAIAATARIHDIYRCVVEGGRASAEDRDRFLGVAAAVMRRLLVQGERLAQLDRALDRLALVEPKLARMVELRYFLGLTLHEAGDAAGITAESAPGQWSRASALLERSRRSDGAA